MEELTLSDLAEIYESLKYSKLKFEGYDYPSEELRRQRVTSVSQLMSKIKKLMDAKKKK